MFGVCNSRNGGTKGRDLPGWCIGSVKVKLIHGIEAGGQCMLRGFWDEAPACWVGGVLKVISADGLTRGSVVPDGLMGG